MFIILINVSPYHTYTNKSVQRIEHCISTFIVSDIREMTSALVRDKNIIVISKSIIECIVIISFIKPV